MATWATAKRAVPGGVHGSRQPRCCGVDPDKDDSSDGSRQWQAWLGSKVGSIWTRIALPFFFLIRFTEASIVPSLLILINSGARIEMDRLPASRIFFPILENLLSASESVISHVVRKGIRLRFSESGRDG